MAPRRTFLFRADPALLDAVQRWANEERRSVNGQIEFLLRRALREAGRRSADEGGEPRGPSAVGSLDEDA